jgi:hypothetical protein
MGYLLNKFNKLNKLNKMNYKGNNYKRIYVKVIGVKKEHYDFVINTKGKKSIAGKLDEIIEFYKINNNCLDKKRR